MQYLYHIQKLSFLTRFPTEGCQNCKHRTWPFSVSWPPRTFLAPYKQLFHVVCQWLSVLQPVASILPDQNHISKQQIWYVLFLNYVWSLSNSTKVTNRFYCIFLLKTYRLLQLNTWLIEFHRVIQTIGSMTMYWYCPLQLGMYFIIRVSIFTKHELYSDSPWPQVYHWQERFCSWGHCV